MTVFGDTLRQLRRDRELSLTQFAVMVRYDKGYLSKLEMGKKSCASQVPAVATQGYEAPPPRKSGTVQLTRKVPRPTLTLKRQRNAVEDALTSNRTGSSIHKTLLRFFVGI
jgi:transcriptional regulator with XRE-family HTH domain